MLKGIIFPNKEEDDQEEVQEDSDDDIESDDDNDDNDGDKYSEQNEEEEAENVVEDSNSDAHDEQVHSSENELDMEDHEGGPELAHRARRVSRKSRAERLHGAMRWSDAVDSLTEGVVDSLQQFGEVFSEPQ